ncbi:OLC1v1029870C1 [Oldenlandia corymbosa var. corymbosa]|uniref:DEAD-box ATP-dependent RNA helicase 21 n=1 Tax=Oldenlandia corymbosa var. corymbosa TaxID=529605 RepID=A0AAV1CFH1_OLDCO|nr:OLC1v1029870C1 [Oldenlandia corymbosa var. corymbosa]
MAITPLFLTKAQREEFALRRREEKIADQKRLAELALQSKFPSSGDDGDRDRGRGRDREREREERKKRGREPEQWDRDSKRRNTEKEREEVLKAKEKKTREEELQLIKDQYMGKQVPKRRVAKPSDKFRFSFDWDNTEDTSILFHNSHEAPLLFGRGSIGGVDKREQKKNQNDSKVDRHWSDKMLDEMTDRDWRIFKEDFNISYKGTRVPSPIRSWSESKLNAKLLKAVERAGYKSPSPIQMAAIPLGLEQRDVIGIAETGSGKTAAFVLPMLTYISRLPPITEETVAQGPYAVVMAPTRELAHQIEVETVKFARHLGSRVVSIVGGESISAQGLKVSQGCEVIIATPGRLLDCLNSRYVVLNQCNYVVLDEADRMIDMNFEPQLVGVLDAMPSSNLKPVNECEELDENRIYRTTFMFSATMSNKVERLARKYLRNPVVVTIGTAGKPTDLITQHVIMVTEQKKPDRLHKLLYELGDKTTIVFVNERTKVDTVLKTLSKAATNCRVTTLHGGMSQEQRKLSLEGFRTKKYNVLVATDVAGRGIDIPDVAHVINYDMPGTIESYTHRIGRTGRAGKTGVATTFLTLNDSDIFDDLKQKLVQSNSHVPPELARHKPSKFKPSSLT